MQRNQKSAMYGKINMMVLYVILFLLKRIKLPIFVKKDMEIWISSIPHFWILGWCELVGKSKAGIEDLFKAEE